MICDSVVLTNYRYSSPLFFQERFYLCSSNVCHLLWVFCWLRALYFSCHRKLLHFQVNIKKNVCVQFLTILVFSINPITLQFNFAHTALHHVAYVALNCTVTLNFIQGLLSAIGTFNSITPNENETNDKICIGHSFSCIWWLQKVPFSFFLKFKMGSVEWVEICYVS